MRSLTHCFEKNKNCFWRRICTCTARTTGLQCTHHCHWMKNRKGYQAHFSDVKCLPTESMRQTNVSPPPPWQSIYILFILIDQLFLTIFKEVAKLIKKGCSSLLPLLTWPPGQSPSPVTLRYSATHCLVLFSKNKNEGHSWWEKLHKTHHIQCHHLIFYKCFITGLETGFWLTE